MALVLKDRVKETSVTTGTGDIVLGGATGAYQTFSIIGNGNQTYYCIAGQATNEWEVGIGTYVSAGNKITRNTILASSNSNTIVTFSAGTKDVFITYPSEKAIFEEPSGETLINAGPITVVGAGVTSIPSLPAELGKFVGNVNSFAQIYTLNQNDGTTASADFVAYNDLTTDGYTYFTDMGISSSNYTSIDYPLFTPNSGYVFHQGGDFFIGNQTTNKDVIIFSGGVDVTDVVATFSGTDLSTTLEGALDVATTLNVGGAATFGSTVLLDANPTLALQAATKQYVDNQVTAGLHIHDPVRVETTANLNATYVQGGTTFNITDITSTTTVTTSVNHGLSVNDQIWLTTTAGNGLSTNTAYFVYSTPALNQLTLSLTFDGTQITGLTNASGLTYATRANSGVGATLTNAGTQAALNVDSIALSAGNRVMVRLQTNGAENGVYVVTTVGSGSTNWVLTRATDSNRVDPGDPNGVGTGDYFFTQEGAINAGDSHVLTTEPNTMIIGYTTLTYTQFSGSVDYVGGTNINITGQTISLTGTVAATNGGTGTATVTTGDLLYGSAANTWSKLPVGAAYKSLVVNSGGTNVEWNAVALNQSAAISGALGPLNGGTGQSAYALGDTLYSSATNTIAKLSGNTTTTKQYLSQTGTGSVSAAPSWATISAADIGAGTLTAVHGGTGQSSYSIGDILYADTTTSLARLADVATGNALISGGLNVAPSWGKIALASAVSGTLPIANGGTNSTATPTAGGVAYGTGTAYAVNTAGTAGQYLISGGAGAPTWTTLPTNVASISFGTTGLTPSTATTGAVTVAGTLALANGGTGATTAQGAMNALAAATTSGSYLRGNGTNVVMSTIQAADVPTLNQNTTGTAGNVTGTVAILNGGTGATTNTAARTNLGATTVGSNFFTLANPTAVTFPRINADNTVSTLDAATFRTAIGAGTSSTTGTVTSVAFSTGTTGLSVSGSPITASGTITLAGTLGVANGGTGATTLTGLVKGSGTSAFTAATAATDYVAPSAYASTNGLTMSTARLLGRTTAGTGAAEEITVGSGLTLSAGTLSAAGGGTSTYSRTSFTATGGQTVFTVSYTVGLLEVFLNGVLLNGTDYTASSGTSITLAVAAIAGDIVETLAFTAGGIVSAVTQVSTSGTVNGLTLTGGPITSTGTITLGGTLSGVNLTSAVTGTLPIANGGTNSIATPTSGGVAYGSGTALAYTSAGTLGQTLQSTGTGIPVFGSSPHASVFTTGTAATYTVPSGATKLKVTVVGGGGNSGASASGRTTGGAAGGVAIKWLTVTPGNTLTYTVGGVGAASTVSSGSLIITTITGNGGGTGAFTAYGATQTAGPAGGTATGGDINVQGQQGGTSYGTGTTVATNFSGVGGNSPFGQGGQMSAISSVAGKAATGYGAGGGGAHASSTAGTGTAGLIIFEPY